MSRCSGSRFVSFVVVNRKVDRCYGPYLVQRRFIATPGFEPTHWVSIWPLILLERNYALQRGHRDDILPLVNARADLRLTQMPYELREVVPWIYEEQFGCGGC